MVMKAAGGRARIMVDQIDFRGGWGKPRRGRDGAPSEIYTGTRAVGDLGGERRPGILTTTSTSYSPECSHITLQLPVGNEM